MPDRPRVAIIGVGLIGGSIGLALRERELADEVIGVGRRLASLEKAQQIGAIDRATTNLVEGVAGADWVIIATPVDSIVDTVTAVAAAAPRATITDAGSTKAQICREIRKLPPSEPGRPAPGAHFIGSHPLAGGHRTGPEFARADLLVDRTVLVTPKTTRPPASWSGPRTSGKRSAPRSSSYLRKNTTGPSPRRATSLT
jgi:prephenate dehydrogenase